MNKYNQRVKDIVFFCTFICVAAFVAPCAGKAADYPYQSFHQYEQTYNYCSSTCKTGILGGYPCSASQYQCAYTAIGFKDQFDLYNPKIFCQSDTAQAPGCVADPLLYLTKYNTYIPDYLQIYIPAGTRKVYIIMYGMTVFGQIATVSQFRTPPVCDVPSSYSDFSFTPGSKYYVKSVTGSTLSDLETGPQFAINGGGAITITVNQNLPSMLTTGGWLYIRLLSYDGSSSTLCQYLVQLDNTTFLKWYDSATWDSYGDPIVSTSPLKITPAALDFGSVPVNTPSTKQVAISNSGSTSLTVNNLLSASNTPFVVNPVSVAVPGGGSQTVNITFTPTAAQNYTDTLTATSNAGNATATLTGTGTTPTKQLTVTGSLNFPTVWKGESSPLALNLSNTGSSNITVSGIQSSDNNAFVIGDWKDVIIPTGNTPQKVWVTFKPSERKLYTGTITINSDNAGGDIVLNASGNGIGEKVSIIKGNFSDTLKLAEVGLKPDKTYTPIKFLNAGDVPTSFSSTSEFSVSNVETAYLTGNYSDFDITVGKFADADDYDRVLMAKTDMNGNIQVSIVNTDGSYQDIALSDGGPKNLFGIRVAAGNFNPSGDSSRSDFLIGGIGNDGNYQINFYKYTGELIKGITGKTPCSAFAINVGKFDAGDVPDDVVVALLNNSETLTTITQKIDGTDISRGSGNITSSDISVGVLPSDPTGVNGYIVSGRTSDGKLALITFDSSSKQVKTISNDVLGSDVHLSTSIPNGTNFGAAISMNASKQIPGVYLFDQNLIGKGSWPQGKTPPLTITTDIVCPDSMYGISSPVLVYLDSSGNLKTVQTPVQ